MAVIVTTLQALAISNVVQGICNLKGSRGWKSFPVSPRMPRKQDGCQSLCYSPCLRGAPAMRWQRIPAVSPHAVTCLLCDAICHMLWMAGAHVVRCHLCATSFQTVQVLICVADVSGMSTTGARCFCTMFVYMSCVAVSVLFPGSCIFCSESR